MQSRFFLTEITDDNQSFERWIRCGFKPTLKGNTNLRREVAGDAQMPEREKKQHNKEKAVHKVTVAERAAVDRHFARREAKPSVRLKVSKNGSDPQIGFDHPDERIGRALVMEALASADWDFVHGIVGRRRRARAQFHAVSHERY